MVVLRYVSGGGPLKIRRCRGWGNSIEPQVSLGDGSRQGPLEGAGSHVDSTFKQLVSSYPVQEGGREEPSDGSAGG